MKRGKKMKLHKKNRKILFSILGAMIVAFIVLFLCNMKFNLLYNHYHYDQMGKTISISNRQLQSDGYKIKKKKYIAKNNDPKFEIKNEGTVSKVTVYFSEKLKKNICVHIYYSIDGQGYNEDASVKKYVIAGKKKKDIYICKENISNLRVDIGEVKGDTFYLKKIVLNEKPDDLNLKNVIIRRAKNILNGRFFRQWELLSIVFVFAALNLFVDRKKMYNKMFDKRWIIALFVLLFFVGNKYNGESLAVYDEYVQPGNGNEYVQPIFGEKRVIRSDDYVVDTPNRMASIKDGKYGKYNEIARGTKTLNAINGVYVGYSTIGRNPFQFAYKIMPAEYAYSFCWYAPIILSFMVAIEFFYILSKRKKLISVAGACLEILSSFYMWWGFPSFILGAQAALVCLNYFIKSKSTLKKIMFGFGVAISFTYYVLTLYPAWIVPMGYVALACLIWIIHENWNKVKQLGIKNWIIVLMMAIFSVSIIINYLMVNQEYVYAITHTVYPGHRISKGGFAIKKIFYYAQAYMYAFSDVGNSPEASSLLSLFPIPIIAGGYKWYNDKKKNWLLTGLLGISAVYLIYTTVGVPVVVAKILLLTYTTATRLVDIIAIIQIYLLVIVLSDEDEKKIPPIKGGIIALITTVLTIYVCQKDYSGYLTKEWSIVTGIVILYLGYNLLSQKGERAKKIFCVLVIVISIITGAFVRPISKGFDAITSKPVSKEISKIVSNEPKAKWLVINGPSGFVLANGAPVINSVNTYPNMELWKTLDKNDRYEKVYNRYAHVTVKLTNKNTTFKVGKASDNIIVQLSYRDMKKTKTKYIYSSNELNVNNRYVMFEKEYCFNGSYIYKVHYK